jgi:hypothetical protein
MKGAAMSRIVKRQVPLITVSILLAAPRATFACSVCMGGSDDAATRGLNAAILTLLTALLLVQGSVVGFLAHLIRRSVKHPLAPPSAPGGVVQ